MTAELYKQLQWLPPAPPDFVAACKALGSAVEVGSVARFLATHALDQNQLGRLGRAVIRAAQEGRELRPLEPFRLAIMGNGTLDLILPSLVATAARHGFALECIQADYGQMVQAALDPTSRINQGKPDAVLLALDHRGLPLQFVTGDAAAESLDIETALRQLRMIRDGIHRNCGAVVLVQTIPSPPEALFGSMDCRVAGTPRRLLEDLNRAIIQSLEGSADLVLDVARLAATVGLATWHSPAQWNLAKLPFDDSCTPIYAEHVLRLITALRGRSRKCLVLDLDNTVWGGILGDDGVDGIRTSRGDASGEAHLAVQQISLDLRRRGVVLAVSSKNTDEVARSAFRLHPEMLLKEEHFAVFQANWSDKASNIEAIARALALSLESVVFLDDNPVERALVRKLLPAVAVPELPDDPAWYARTLTAAGYFESIGFSAEDRSRADMYQSNAQRLALQNESEDLAGYLASLEMDIYFSPFDRTGRTRIAQLINKSNQFNLTTRRYTAAEVDAAAEDSAVFTMQARLTDKYGDNGMICVIICRDGGIRTWDIDTWLMSCRVLGREVERAVLGGIVMRARAAGIATLVGSYIPTGRNDLVRDHYDKLGFTQIAARSDGTTFWSLDTSRDVEGTAIRVRWSGADSLAT